MQNAKWSGDAGTDQWNICVSHSTNFGNPGSAELQVAESCQAVSYSLSISGFGNGEEISTCVILLSGSRLASGSTSCLGSVRVLRNRILVILPLTLILLRL